MLLATLLFPPDTSQSLPSRLDTRGIQKFAYHDPAHQAQCRRATFVICITRKRDARRCVAGEGFDLFACNTSWVVGVAYTGTAGSNKKESAGLARLPFYEPLALNKRPLLTYARYQQVCDSNRDSNPDSHFSSTAIWRGSSIREYLATSSGVTSFSRTEP